MQTFLLSFSNFFSFLRCAFICRRGSSSRFRSELNAHHPHHIASPQNPPTDRPPRSIDPSTPPTHITSNLTAYSPGCMPRGCTCCCYRLLGVHYLSTSRRACFHTCIRHHQHDSNSHGTLIPHPTTTHCTLPPTLLHQTGSSSNSSSTRSIMAAAAARTNGRRRASLWVVCSSFLMACLLAPVAQAGVMGVDLGSEFMKVSLVRPRVGC